MRYWRPFDESQRREHRTLGTFSTAAPETILMPAVAPLRLTLDFLLLLSTKSRRTLIAHTSRDHYVQSHFIFVGSNMPQAVGMSATHERLSWRGTSSGTSLSQRREKGRSCRRQNCIYETPTWWPPTCTAIQNPAQKLTESRVVKPRTALATGLPRSSEVSRDPLANWL